MSVLSLMLFSHRNGANLLKVGSAENDDKEITLKELKEEPRHRNVTKNFSTFGFRISTRRGHSPRNIEMSPHGTFAIFMLFN